MDVRHGCKLVLLVGLIGVMALSIARGPRPTSRWARPADGVFLVEPYVQLGDPPGSSAERVAVLWQGADRNADWSVEARRRADGPWTRADTPTWRRVAVEGLEPRRLFRATVSGLIPGSEFAYRVRRGGVPVFEARARARKAAGQPHRFVAFGDGGADTAEQKAVAYQASLARPDFVMITGDLVYFKGRMAEYLSKFFPIYNAGRASPTSGAPLLRSTPFLVAPGNHDLIERDLDAVPDALAYFLVWSLPLNGPIARAGSANSPILSGTEPRRRAFLEAAGPAYPRMASYSFDFGDAHWTVLDTNPYVDWSDPALRAWLERDLAAARRSPWRFVAFHQPPFHSSKTHSEEQRTRLLVDLFEKYHVAIVFCGHIHNYQRSYPLRFVAERAADGRAIDPEGRVKGHWSLDRSFDGRTRTRPVGVIYLVTGAGGARLYNADQHDDAASWQEFTARFISNTHSLTVVDVDASTLTARQVSDRGVELDRFVVTRSDDDIMDPARPSADGGHD